MRWFMGPTSLEVKIRPRKGYLGIERSAQLPKE